MESILLSIKKFIGPTVENTYFDNDLIMAINTELMVLTQLGIGPSTGFSITDETDLWSDFIEDISMLEGVKTYVSIRVRLTFDPPTSSSVKDALEKKAAELEWRLTNHL